jgi:tRNA A37 N6-isopentenylltransferase MiaA
MIKDEMEKYREEDRQQEAGVCIVGEVRKDREEIKPSELQEEAERTVKNLEIRLAESLEVNEAHQKINGKLQQRVTELEEDNKKLAREIEDRVHKMRKSGM